MRTSSVIAFMLAISIVLGATPDTVGTKILYASVGETIDVSLYFSSNSVQIKFNGPDQYFHGVGFNGVEMNGTYAIIVVGNSNQIEEHSLGNNAPGTVLPPSITVVSNTVTNGVRDVVLTRNMKGLTDQYYSFQPQANQKLNIIYCYGTTPQVQWHGPARNTTVLQFAPPSINK